MRTRHLERHRTERVGWLRAAVLGANDGVLSTASLVLGVAAAEASRSAVLVAGVAGLVAGTTVYCEGLYSRASLGERNIGVFFHSPWHMTPTCDISTQ